MHLKKGVVVLGRTWRFVASCLVILLVAMGADISAGTTATAVGTYNNADIADRALAYIGQWGGNACRDAGKTQSGQCKQFANCIVFLASGRTQWPVDPGKNYQHSYRVAGGVEITALPEVTKGDIIQVGSFDGGNLHTAIVVQNKGGGRFNVVDSNYNYDEIVRQHDYIPPSGARFWRMGTVNGVPPASGHPPSAQPITLLDHASAVWAKNSLGGSGWTRETANDSAKKVAAGGNTHVLLDWCGSVWARSGVGEGGWVQETACDSAQDIAVSETGLQMLLDWCGAIWAKRGVGWGGWVQQANCHSAKTIAAGGNTQMVINLCGAIWAKDGIDGMNGWAQETSCDSAVAVAVGSTGIHALLDFCGAVYAKRGTGWGAWIRQTDCGHKAVAVGGEDMIVLNACHAIWGRSGVGTGGWTQETDCHSAKAIAMGSNNRRVLLAFDEAIWAKEGPGFGGWGQQTGPWSARMIDVG